ncbi:MAG: hypothetical protein KGL39_18480 [Patescibacteria group bacterium]|nr:hypothetical protein [Patescibacteria group bacterium]
MSKAIRGAVEIAAGIALESVPGGQIFGAMLINAGIATEAGAIAAAIGSQQGIGVTTRQAAGLRQIVYGTQRLGGTSIYQSTTGGVGDLSGKYVFNYIIVLATHEIDAIQNLYLDGRQVYWRSDNNAANVGCGSVSNPPATTVTLSGGAVSSVTATGGSGFHDVMPARYRVRFQGDGSGAYGYATNSGTISSPVWTVHVTNGGSGYTHCTAEIQGAYTFGGVARSDDPDPTSSGYGKGYGIGPGGPHYNFDGKVFCEARFGDQPPGDYMASFSAYDPTWPSTARVGGCAYIYLNVGYDQSQFPQSPEIKLTINGKNSIYDPRTGLTGYSTNWALQVADVLTDPVYGLGDQVNTAQLIAAANVCDELILTSQGNEAQWAQHIHYDTGTSPGEALALMMPNAAGRVTYIGGEWFIWPAYWQGSSFTWDESALLAEPSWNPYRSFKELVNRVTGTYIAPNYPYNVAGNLYDKNGWWYGTTANLWPLAFQPTNFPQYAADTLHGFSSDVFLTEDGGVQLPLELELRGCLSIVQAQRTAKVHLMRNRFQGAGVFRMRLACYQMQPTDVMQFSFPAMNWINKYLEIGGPFQFCVEPLSGESGGGDVPAIFVEIPVNETDPTIYEWSTSEELTPYDVPAQPAGLLYSSPEPPSGITLTDNSSTALIQDDGTTMPRMLVQWTPSADPYVVFGGGFEIQWRDHSLLFQSGAWIEYGKVSGAASFAFIDGLDSVYSYDVQIRSFWSNGAVSDWVSPSTYNPIRPRPLLSSANQVAGTTANPTLGSSMADLPELGASDAPMTITTKGNPCLFGVNLKFAAISSGGAVTSIGSLTLPNTTGYGPPSFNIVISGDGSGAMAHVGWTAIGGSGSSTIWQPSLVISAGGSGYTTATATVTCSNPGGDPGYASGTTTYACGVSSTSPAAGVPVAVQVLMDDGVIFGPSTISTNADGYATLYVSDLILPAPAAGSHLFQVQAMTSSATAVTSTNRTFQLVELG